MESYKLYVGNLPYSVTSEQLRELFAQYGEVVSVNVIEQRGFAFVEMSDKGDAVKAKEELNETEFNGRNIIVNEARPKSRDSKGYKSRNRRY